MHLIYALRGKKLLEKNYNWTNYWRTLEKNIFTSNSLERRIIFS